MRRGGDVSGGGGVGDEIPTTEYKE